MFADMDNYLSTKGHSNGLSIDGDPDIDKLEYLYQGLKDRGLSDSEALNVIQRMKSESNLDAYSESDEGDGLIPELGYRSNMFSDDEDTEIDRQLNAVVRSIRTGKIKTDTISGALDSEITRGLGFNSFSEGGDIEIADNGSSSDEFAWYPSDSILNYIKKIEGYRPYWYKDGNGVMTIGYGFTDTGLMKTHPKWMSRADADKRFKEEIDSRISSFISATPNFDKLTDSQRDALFDYYYNIGHGNYTKGSPGMQAALAAGDLYAVRDSIDIGYNDKNNTGLRQRRDYERSLFELESAPEPLAPVGSRKISYDIPVWDSKTALWATKQNMPGRVMQNKFRTGGNFYDGESTDSSQMTRNLDRRSKDKLRAEMLARYSGGIGGIEDAVWMKTSPLKLVRVWNNDYLPEEVASGAMTPKEYLDSKSNVANYSGTLLYDINMDSSEAKRNVLNSNHITKANNNDFVSAFFNNSVPMEWAGVTASPATQNELYRRVFRTNYPAVVGGDSIRAYLVNPETLPEAEELDRLAGMGEYTYDTVTNSDNSYRIGDKQLGYDANNHTLITVNYGDNVYDKHLDVFDVQGLGKEGSLTRSMTDFITEYGSPYIIASPWKVRKR